MNIETEKNSRFVRQPYSINRHNLSEFLCTAALAMLGINYLLYSFLEVGLDRYFLRISAGICFIISIILNNNMSIKEFALIFICIYMIAINGNLSQNIAYFLLAFIAIPVSSKKVWKHLHVIQLILLCVVILSIFTGTVNTHITSFGGRIRNTLGFTNVNSAAVFLFSFLIIWMLQKDKIRWFHICGSLCTSYYIYILTDSRTSITALGIFCAVYLLLSKWNGKYITYVICAIELILFFTPIIVGIIYRIFPQVDALLSYRLQGFNNYINSNTMKSFLFGGSKVPEVDNFYLCLLFNGGILFYCFMILMCIKSTCKFMKEGKIKYVAFFIAILSFGLMEASIIRSEILCMIMFWFLMLITLKKDKNKYADEN